MAEYIVSKGETSSGMVLNHDSMFILKGGTASDTTLNEEADMHVSNGGTAIKTTVNSRGWMYVSKGGKASDTTLNSYGWMLVSSGGTVDTPTVSSGGQMVVFKGGKVNSASICSAGYFELFGGTINRLSFDRASGFVSSGGTINDLTMNSGYIYIYSGTINRATVQNGDIYVYSGGKLNSATFNSGRLNLHSSGTANKITLENGAQMDIYGNGAKANGVTVKTGGSMFLDTAAVVSNLTFAGGEADPAKYQYAGQLAAYGTVNGLTIGSGTSISLNSGCTATKVKWTPGNGVVNIWGATVSFTSKYSGVYVGSNGAFVSQSKELVSETLKLGASAYVAKGGVASGIKLESGGSVNLWNGGKALQIQLGIGESSSYMNISSGGTASDVTIFEHGGLEVLSGGKAGDITICSGGNMYISRGTASGIKLESGGGLGIYNGTATDVEWTPFEGELELWEGAQITFANELTGVFIGTNGMLDKHTDKVEGRTIGDVDIGIKYSVKEEMYVMSEGMAKSIIVGNNGSMYVFDGGTADSTTICDGGQVYVYNGGSASIVEVSGGELAVYGGTATDVTINEDGDIYVAGGSASGVTVDSGGSAIVCSGGRLDDATVYSAFYRQGGYIKASSGAVLSDITLQYGARLYVSKGAKVTNVTSSYGSYIELEKGATVKKITAVEAWSPDCDYDTLNGWADKKKKTINEHIVNSTPTPISSKTHDVQIDENEASFFDNYVGYGDEIDFLKVQLSDAAKLSFGVTATDASKFTVWRWDDGKNKLVSLQASTLKLKEESNIKSGAKGSALSRYYYVETKELLLDAGDYYLSMESTNAAKGGNAYYNVFLSSDSYFFVEGNNADDDWTALPDKYDFGALDPKPQELVDEEWIGYGDDIDYRKFAVSNDVKANFDVYASDASTKFTLYQLVSKTDKKGKTTNSLKKLTSLAIKKFDEEYGLYRGVTAECDLKRGEEYYFCMESANAAKGGSAYYHVDILTSDTDDDLGGGGKLGGEVLYLYDALAMPETDNLGLSFASLDTDVLADASAFDKLATVDDLNWQAVTKLA